MGENSRNLSFFLGFFFKLLIINSERLPNSRKSIFLVLFEYYLRSNNWIHFLLVTFLVAAFPEHRKSDRPHRDLQTHFESFLLETMLNSSSHSGTTTMNVGFFQGGSTSFLQQANCLTRSSEFTSQPPFFPLCTPPPLSTLALIMDVSSKSREQMTNWPLTAKNNCGIKGTEYFGSRLFSIPVQEWKGRVGVQPSIKENNSSSNKTRAVSLEGLWWHARSSGTGYTRGRWKRDTWGSQGCGRKPTRLPCKLHFWQTKWPKWSCCSHLIS